MSVKALSAVFEDSCAKDSAFVVLLAMADWADHNGRCYPSYAQIAKKARISRATAIASITELVKLGELERVEQGQAPTDDDEAPAKVRTQWRNLYRIALVRPRPQVVQPPDHQPSPEPEPQVVQPLDHLEPEAVQPSDHLSDGAVALGSPTDTAQVVQPTGSHIRNSPSGRPSEELKAGAAPRPPALDDPDDNVGVITKIAHETIDLCGEISELDEAVKCRIADLNRGRDERSKIRYDSAVVRKAIESAQWQRAHRRQVRA